MSTELLRPLGTFTDWIRTTDDHATCHLELLGQAERILAGRETASASERQALATRLERWRYQRLNECCRAMAGEDQELLESLDLAANALAGRTMRRPRRVREAIHGGADVPEVATARSCLDPTVPLEELVARAESLTREHFSVPSGDNGAGAQRRMVLYAPLYLSSHCVNHCVYCGFNYTAPIERKQLGPEEVLREAEILRGRGFRHVLLVAGDFPSRTTTAYLAGMIRMLRGRGFQPAVEIASQTTEAYAELREAGACGVTLYQETYDEALYALYHPRGTKASYDWRLEALERAAEAGIRRLGLGVLLGLGEPRADLAALVRHAVYLRDRFADSSLAFSLPRITEAPSSFRQPFEVDDELFLRMVCTLRVVFPGMELVLSTRERPALRDRLARVCITQMSAGSSTVPGGYGHQRASEEPDGQFPISDRRTADAIERWLLDEGFAVDWEIDRPKAK